MEKIFKIDIASQLHIEQCISTMNLGGFSNDCLDFFIPRDNKTYWDYYVRDTPSPLLNDVMPVVRLCYYQTYLPGNHPSDHRFGVPPYAVGIGT